MNEVKKEKLSRIVSFAVLISFTVPIVFLIYHIIVAPVEIPNSGILVRTKSDYVLMLIQCVLGVGALVLPKFIIRKYKVKIPNNMYLLYLIFLYSAIFLGELRNLYNSVPYWDTVLHAFSGGMIGALGFSFVSLLNDEESMYLHLSPFFVAFFAFCFALALGVIWEIYEYICDGVLQLNMQKFALEFGEQLLGREALADTMEDLIVDAIGAFTLAIIGYISLKYKKGWIEKFIIRKYKG